jgi:5'-deoxynucleotidase
MALTIAEQMRASHVTRWHIVATSRKQSLAEHLFNVCILSVDLAGRVYWPGILHDSEKMKLMDYALRHDLIEVRTGDIPTPFKKVLKALIGADVMHRAESEVDNDQSGFCRLYAGTDIERIVKMADMIDAIQFCTDTGVGLHAKGVIDGLRQDFDAMVNQYEKECPHLRIREGCRSICRDLGVWGGML